MEMQTLQYWPLKVFINGGIAQLVPGPLHFCNHPSSLHQCEILQYMHNPLCNTIFGHSCLAYIPNCPEPWIPLVITHNRFLGPEVYIWEAQSDSGNEVLTAFHGMTFKGTFPAVMCIIIFQLAWAWGVSQVSHFRRTKVLQPPKEFGEWKHWSWMVTVKGMFPPPPRCCTYEFR